MSRFSHNVREKKLRLLYKMAAITRVSIEHYR